MVFDEWLVRGLRLHLSCKGGEGKTRYNWPLCTPSHLKCFPLWNKTISARIGPYRTCISASGSYLIQISVYVFRELILKLKHIFIVGELSCSSSVLRRNTDCGVLLPRSHKSTILSIRHTHVISSLFT